MAANFKSMTLHQSQVEVGVRELHDRLSKYLEKVQQGAEVLVTRRGKPIARMSQVDAPRPFEDLERRGLVRWPEKPRDVHESLTGSSGSVSELVSDQRR
jgi:antitoxin (DNA-binding transcriptional repressor) of toxin-antitoxin stability system